MNELVARVRRLLVVPREQLASSLAESGDLRDLLVPDVLLLAALGPLAGFLSMGIIGVYQPPTQIFNMVVPGGFVRAPATAALLAVIRFGLAVGAWLTLALCLERLAPAFGGRRDGPGSRKAAVATLTPVWLAASLVLLSSVPYLEILGTLAVLAALAYGVWIALLAVPVHLAVPEPKALGLVSVSLAITIGGTTVAYWALGSLIQPHL